METKQKANDDLVAEFLSRIIQEVALMIEGKVMDSFEIDFEIDGRRFKMNLIENNQNNE